MDFGLLVKRSEFVTVSLEDLANVGELRSNLCILQLLLLFFFEFFFHLIIFLFFFLLNLLRRTLESLWKCRRTAANDFIFPFHQIVLEPLKSLLVFVQIKFLFIEI